MTAISKDLFLAPPVLDCASKDHAINAVGLVGLAA
jgi:hypothetical protein